MVPSSYLRIYQPLASFPLEERERWSAYVANPPQIPPSHHYRHVAFNASAQTGMLFPSGGEHAYIKKVNGEWLVCPWRMRLRVLVGLLSFRNSLPESADAWIPEGEALRAAEELEALRDEEPEIRNNITTASWYVPLRWFIAFDDSERILEEVGSKGTIRYETDLRSARTRVEQGLKVLREAGMAESQCEPVADLAEWLSEFPYDSQVELDYGTVANLFTVESLGVDHSAEEMWSVLEALSTGDYETSAGRYNDLAALWNRVKSLESAN
ncbi:MAG: hypothetical protein ABIS18_12065 [Actinomycetota bacterium]